MGTVTQVVLGLGESSESGGMMEIPILTAAGFKVMQDNIANVTKDAPQVLGVSVALWRLRALMTGYQYALDHGYTVGVTVEKDTQEEVKA